MKGGWGLIVVLAIAVVVVFAVAFSGILPSSDDAAITGLAAGQTTQFQGKTLQFSEPWRRYVPGSRGNMLSLKKSGGGRAGATLTLEDERRKPEDVQRFVSGWMSASTANAGFHPQSIDEYRDPAVESAGMRCVSIHWPDARRPLQLICIASNGRWKLTLMGAESDIPGLDALAQQMPQFQNGL